MPSAGLPASRFVAGCVHQGELHVTPLKEILQLRPSFSYLDRADTKQVRVLFSVHCVPWKRQLSVDQ